MGAIVCEECRAEFEPEELAIKNRVIVDGETYEKVTETYFLCPVCGAHYTVTVLDRQQRLMVQRRRRLQQSYKGALKIGKPKRADTYKEQERKLAKELKERAKMLKEKYRGQIEEG